MGQCKVFVQSGLAEDASKSPTTLNTTGCIPISLESFDRNFLTASDVIKNKPGAEKQSQISQSVTTPMSQRLRNNHRNPMVDGEEYRSSILHLCPKKLHCVRSSLQQLFPYSQSNYGVTSIPKRSLTENISPLVHLQRNFMNFISTNLN